MPETTPNPRPASKPKAAPKPAAKPKSAPKAKLAPNALPPLAAKGIASDQLSVAKRLIIFCHMEADAGNPFAMLKLGRLCLNAEAPGYELTFSRHSKAANEGLGIDKDANEAIRRLERAGSQGEVRSRETLVEIYGQERLGQGKLSQAKLGMKTSGKKTPDKETSEKTAEIKLEYWRTKLAECRKGRQKHEEALESLNIAESVMEDRPKFFSLLEEAKNFGRAQAEDLLRMHSSLDLFGTRGL